MNNLRVFSNEEFGEINVIIKNNKEYRKKYHEKTGLNRLLFRGNNEKGTKQGKTLAQTGLYLKYFL